MCLCNGPGLGGRDFKDNHFGFTEKSSGSDLRSYKGHLFPSRDVATVLWLSFFICPLLFPSLIYWWCFKSSRSKPPACKYPSQPFHQNVVHKLASPGNWLDKKLTRAPLHTYRITICIFIRFPVICTLKFKKLWSGLKSQWSKLKNVSYSGL